MSRIDSALRTILTLSTLFTAGLANAELGGLFWGAQSSLVAQSTDYENAAYESSESASDSSGLESSKESRLASAGMQVGWRHTLDQLFIALQVEARYTFGETQGIVAFDELEDSGLNTSWTDRWNAVSRSEAGAIAKFGREFSLFTFARINLYLLGGMKASGVELDIDYSDFCPTADDCTDEQLESGKVSYAADQRLLVYGTGLERALTASSSFCLEYRIESEIDVKWTANDDPDRSFAPKLVANRSFVTASINKYF